MLVAFFLRPATCWCGDVCVKNRRPILALCRALVARGYEEQPMVVRDAQTEREIVSIGSIHYAATRTVKEASRPCFRKYVPFPRGAAFCKPVVEAETAAMGDDHADGRFEEPAAKARATVFAGSLLLAHVRSSHILRRKRGTQRPNLALSRLPIHAARVRSAPALP
ncbi:hypothetical protein [Azospirillum soli]|uniref:hypothetical protein n=1 Tax=Azospirillum soli TaxID=1304799 RepID=UPI001AE849DD|nr:hypothetical protein [Azospirillum soli]MBP2316054.1 hypothetical protein [Azospirillum soli]